MPGKEKKSNTGTEYEIDSFGKCESKGLIFPGTSRGGASNKPDIIVCHHGQPLNIEVKKLKTSPDMCQRYLKFDETDGWGWQNPDGLTDYYDSKGFLKQLAADLSPNYIPRRLTKNPNEITQEDRDYDLANFKKNIEGEIKEIYYPLKLEALFLAYKLKNVYYVQCEDFGFYHLDSDKYNLGTQQYDGNIRLRMRFKNIHSSPPKAAMHQAVIKKELVKCGGHPTKSNYDIDEKENRTFPEFRP